MPADRPSRPVQEPPADQGPAGPTDITPNRAMRRGTRGGEPASARHRGAALAARGKQGRRIVPVRRTG